MSSDNADEPPEVAASPVDLLSGEADAAIAAAAKTTESFTIDGEDDTNGGEEDDIPTPLKESLKERKPSTGSHKPSKSGVKMAKLSDKTSKIMNDYQTYLQEIETEFPSEKPSPVDQVKDSIRVGYQAGLAAPPYRDNPTPPPTLASMTKEYNTPTGDQPLRRGWDYGDDEEEGSLNMRDHLTRGQKYTYPLLHSKRFKKAICCFALNVAVVVIITVSVSAKKKKDANLPDWEGDYAAIEEEGKGKQQQQGDTMHTPDQTPYVNDEKYQESMSYEMASTTYHPVFFERTEDNYYPDGSYLEALQFCGNHNGYGLCPFAAVCPNGVGADPIRGVQKGGPSWNPVSDRVDEWVQLGADGKCTLYSQNNIGPPEWGTKGGNEDATRNMVCCLQQGDSGVIPPVATSTGLSGVSSTSTNKVASIEFDRSKDWTGQTYGKAADFCGQKGYSICPYDVICPDGTNHAPSSGIKPGSDGQWVPISDEIHDWVQVGTDIPCVRWLQRHPDTPIWSQTGADNEEITRYIYCCSGGAVVSTAATSPATLSTTIKIPIDSQNIQDESIAAAAALIDQAESLPGIQWYDRSTGYDGQTYTEAYMFCLEKAQGVPCRFESICPSGDGTMPNGGYRAPSGEAWVPIKESVVAQDDNAWVSVSAENSCTRYDRLHAAPPVWGNSGESNEDITRNVACCPESQPPTNQVRY